MYTGDNKVAKLNVPLLVRVPLLVMVSNAPLLIKLMFLFQRDHCQPSCEHGQIVLQNEIFLPMDVVYTKLTSAYVGISIAKTVLF